MKQLPVKFATAEIQFKLEEYQVGSYNNVNDDAEYLNLISNKKSQFKVALGLPPLGSFNSNFVWGKIDQLLQ